MDIMHFAFGVIGVIREPVKYLNYIKYNNILKKSKYYISYSFSRENTNCQRVNGTGLFRVLLGFNFVGPYTFIFFFKENSSVLPHTGIVVVISYYLPCNLSYQFHCIFMRL